MSYPTTKAKTPYGEGVITFLPDRTMRFESSDLVVNRIELKATIEIEIIPGWSSTQDYRIVVNSVRRSLWEDATPNAAKKVLDLVCKMLEKTYLERPEVQHEVESVRLERALDSVKGEIDRLEKKLREAKRERFSLCLQKRRHDARVSEQHDG